MKTKLINIALILILVVLFICIVSGQIQKVDFNPTVLILLWFGQYVVFIGSLIGLIYNNK